MLCIDTRTVIVYNDDMSKKIEKIVSKMNQCNKGWDFESCLNVLIEAGYEIKLGEGNYFKFFKKRMIVIARHHPVSPDVVNDVLKAWDNNLKGEGCD